MVPQQAVSDELQDLLRLMFHAHPWHGVAPGDPAGVVEAYVFLRAMPIGGLRMIDGDEADDKIVAVLERDIAYGDLRDIGDAPKGIVERLRHYFLTYKQMPGERARAVRIAEVYDRVEAVEVLRRSIEDYREAYGDPQKRAAQLSRLIGI